MRTLPLNPPRIPLSMLYRALLCGLLAAALLAAGQLPAAAQPVPAPDALDTGAIDAFVAAQMQKHHLPGVSLAVTSGDQIVYAKGYGLASRSRSMTPDTPMFIGSTSKSITGMALLQLSGQGKVDLNAPVQTYLPWFRIADEQASKTLTVAQLAHHASGLSDRGFDYLPPEIASMEEVARMMATARQTAPAGMRSQYFNQNYMLLALVIESASGQSYQDYVQANIFTPLQMTHSYLDLQTAQENGLAQGYSRIFPFVIPSKQPYRRYDLATGYIVSTANDLAHLLIAMHHAGQYAGRQVFTPDSVHAALAPLPGVEGFQYGVGWFLDEYNGVQRASHGGANETFKTQAAFYPNQDRGVVILVNQGYLIDAYISTAQLFNGIEDLVTGTRQPSASSGLSVTLIGAVILVFFLVLFGFMSLQIARLPSWPARARTMTPANRWFDIALNFIIPTVIIYLVFTALSSFFADRFNLWQQLAGMFVRVPDLMLLTFVGTIPDYAQGITKIILLALKKV